MDNEIYVHTQGMQVGLKLSWITGISNQKLSLDKGMVKLIKQDYLDVDEDFEQLIDLLVETRYKDYKEEIERKANIKGSKEYDEGFSDGFAKGYLASLRNLAEIQMQERKMKEREKLGGEM